MQIKFKDVAHLYKGVPMKTEMGIFTLICYHDGQWILDTISYGANAVEQNIKPILRLLSDMKRDERSAYFEKQDSVIGSDMKEAVGTYYLLSKHFDLFGLIESGEAIDSTTLK